MRILVNGYFYGGNCPPFMQTLKTINQDSKLTNALSVLDEYGFNHDCLNDNDILYMPLNRLEKKIIPFVKKIKIPYWKTILVRRAKDLIHEYKPDIIINHKASEKAEVMLKTGFRPQITYVYGGEVHGDRVSRKELDYVFSASNYIITTTESMKSYIIDKRKSLKDKIKVFPMGYFDLDSVLEFKKTKSKLNIKIKFQIAEDVPIFLENRSLRGKHAGLDAIIKAVKILIRRGQSFKIFVLKGFLGVDSMAKKLRNIMRDDSLLAKHMVFIDEIIPKEEILEYFHIADAFISLLPADQFGKCISDAMFMDCSLILSDLDAYRNRLGNGPCYIRNQDPNELASAMENIIDGRTYKVEKKIYDNLYELSQTSVRFAKLLEFLNDVVNKKSDYDFR